ncbi:unannotated protein [freshwater metagenome]|uniref:Unannotated protein n=1 Tax=freshwater metagenome TaxID=449393 RepID=A0A6J7T8H7_9ZZZZ
MTFCYWLVSGQRRNHFFISWPCPCHGVLQNVLWNVDQNRTRTTCCCNMKCLTNCHRNVIGMHDEFVVLCDAASNANGVAFLECICTNSCGWHLASDADHRNGVHECIAQWGDHVCCSRTASHHCNAGTTCDMGITLRHVACTLFMSNKDVSDAGLQQRVVCRQNASAWQTKHDLHVFHLQRTNECFGSCECLFIRHRVSPSCYRLL